MKLLFNNQYQQRPVSAQGTAKTLTYDGQFGEEDKDQSGKVQGKENIVIASIMR